MKENNIINFTTPDTKNEPVAPVVGSLALNPQPVGGLDVAKVVDFFNEDEQYEKPVVKKLVIKRQTKKIFMGCWQGCNEDNEGDGC